MADDGTYLRTETVPIHRTWGTHRDGKVKAGSPHHRAWASSRDGPVTSAASWKQTQRWATQTTSPKKRTGSRSSSPTKKSASMRAEGRLGGRGKSTGFGGSTNRLSTSVGGGHEEQENLGVTAGKRLMYATEHHGPGTFSSGPMLSAGVSPRRPQLKIGASATKKLMKTKRTKEILASTKGANDDEARIQKRAIKDTFNAWVDGKKDIERTQRMEAAAAQEAHGNIDFDGFQRRADDAFDKWKANKKEQAKRKKLKGGSKSGPVTVSEFICGWRRLNLGPLDLLLNYQSLLLALDTNGKIDPDKFTVMMTQVEIQLKTDLAIKQLDAADIDKPPPGAKRTQGQIEKDRLEKVQVRIGQQILKTIAPNRQAFGQSMKNIESIFIAMDEDGNGRLERHEFRDGLKRLDLGINSTQFVELLKGFDEDGSGDIDYSEFENFLIRCKAIQDRDNPRAPNMKFDMAWSIAESMHFEMDDIRARFTDALQNVLDTRIHRAGKSGAAGKITTAELKARLTIDDSPMSKFGSLPLTQRKDILKAFNDVHKIVDSRASRKTGVVSIDEIDLFMLMVEQRLNDKIMEKEMDPVEKKRNDSRYKICKTMLKNGALQNMSFAHIMRALNKANRPFIAISEETGGRVLHAEHFKLSVKSLNLGLSIVQTDDLIESFDAEGSLVIDADHFIHFLYYAKERMDREAEWKKDPRSRICDDLLRLVTPNDVIKPMFKQLYFQLNHDQVHRLRPARRTSQTALADSMASYSSDRRASVAGMSSAFGDDQQHAANSGRTVGYDDDFDATWAPSGQEVVMPPGSKPAGAHWTTGKLDRGEGEEQQPEIPKGSRSRRGSVSSNGGGRQGSVGSRRGSIGAR